eukprot:2670791-Prymnesium_polylepis.2
MAAWASVGIRSRYSVGVDVAMPPSIKVGVLAPLSVFAQLPAVISPEADHRVLGIALLLECIEHEPDVVIGEADRGVVRPPQALGDGRRQDIARNARVVQRRDIEVLAQLAPVAPRDRGHTAGRPLVGGQLDLVRRVEVEEARRRDKRQVRLVEADGKKEGPAGRVIETFADTRAREVGERLDGILRDLCVRQWLLLLRFRADRDPAVAAAIAPRLALLAAPCDGERRGMPVMRLTFLTAPMGSSRWCVLAQ